MANEKTYKGPLYIRPIGRGWCVANPAYEDLEEHLGVSDGYYEAIITLRPLTPTEQEELLSKIDKR